MLANRFHSSMNFDPSLPNDSRRNFVKKSLAASIIAAQPTILAGLIRAQGGGGGTGTTDPWGTTEAWGGTEPLWTVDPWATTDPWTTTDPFQTTSNETTSIETTDEHVPKEWIYRLFAEFNAAVTPPTNDNQVDLAQRSGRIFTGTLYCFMTTCTGVTRTITFPVETGGYEVSVYLDRNFDNGVDEEGEPNPRGSDAGIPPGNFTVSRQTQIEVVPNRNPPFKIPEGHNVDCTIRDHGRDAVLVHGPIRDPGTSGCIAITSDELFAKWSRLMKKTRCSLLASCKEVDYPVRVPLRVRYTIGLRWRWILPINQVPAPASNQDVRPNPYPPQYENPEAPAVPQPVAEGANENV
jgi:hypothetical protein